MKLLRRLRCWLRGRHRIADRMGNITYDNQRIILCADCGRSTGYTLTVRSS